MNKKELITALAATTGTTKSNCEMVVDALTEVVTDGLINGEVVSLPGLGKFSVIEREARTGRNPSTGEEIEIAASCTAKFKVSGILKDTIKESVIL